MEPNTNETPSSDDRKRGPGGPDRGDRGDRGDKGDKGARKRGFARRKVCRFCADKNVKIDYKDAGTLKHFITDRGKIIPRRISGNCAKHQRAIATAVKRARMIALMPFAVTGK